MLLKHLFPLDLAEIALVPLLESQGKLHGTISAGTTARKGSKWNNAGATVANPKSDWWVTRMQ